MRFIALIILVAAQFTVVPFIGQFGHNKAPQFKVNVNQTIAYKNS